MRLTLASLLAGGCLLATATVATADEIRLDETALDAVVAGATLEQRRAVLLGNAAQQLAVAFLVKQLQIENETPEQADASYAILAPLFLATWDFRNTQVALAGPEWVVW